MATFGTYLGYQIRGGNGMLWWDQLHLLFFY